MTHPSVPLHTAALFLDLDGTLAPIAERPEDVGPDRLRNSLLRNLGRALGGRLAIVSGRPMEDIDRILDDSVRCIAGVHGLERRMSSGHLQSVDPHPDLDRVYTILEEYVSRRPGLYLEFKMLAVALHYRQAPQYAVEVLNAARRLAWATGLKLQEGRMVVELRSPGADKGDAVRAFMREPPFITAFPIFVGDDITDEDGFAAAQGLGGAGVLVGPRRETTAIARLSDVGAVLTWVNAAVVTGFFELDFDE